MYRVSLVVVILGWVDFLLVIPLSAWADGNLADSAWQLSKMVEH